MALPSCTKISVGVMVAYVAYVSWTMYMLFFPSTCDDSKDPSRCVAPLHDGDSDYKASSLQRLLVHVMQTRVKCMRPAALCKRTFSGAH